jgi:hypothetical protein
MTTYHFRFVKTLCDDAGHQHHCLQGEIEVRRARTHARALRAAELKFQRVKVSKIAKRTLTLLRLSAAGLASSSAAYSSDGDRGFAQQRIILDSRCRLRDLLLRSGSSPYPGILGCGSSKNSVNRAASKFGPRAMVENGGASPVGVF